MNEKLKDLFKGKTLDGYVERAKIIDDIDKLLKEDILNVPCKKCGRNDLPLHYNRLCPDCFEEAK